MNRFQLFLVLLMLSVGLHAQGLSAWVTYGQSGISYSPGIELNYAVKHGWGIQLGVNSLLIQTDEKYLVAPLEKSNTELFNNVNLSLSKHLLDQDDSRLGASVGLKAYLGSNYKILHSYEAGNYDIYYNANGSVVCFGVDFGLFYSYKSLSFLFKYDTAFNKVRLGVGYYFGNANK